ncbi:MAG: type II toxin-antitoxin system VapC family toxin [Ignavibacteria bacterium]|nr:type II toxin-antitoxin system VapC family toxin [Ignavibacteria bacterium]
MSGDYLVDTNIVIAYFNKDNIVGKRIDVANEIFIPCIVIGELYFGAIKSRNRIQNISIVDNFVSNKSIVNCDVDTAKEFGTIKHQLQSKGKPIPDNDIWIAAIAKQYKLTLVTRDEHFREVENLFIENW